MASSTSNKRKLPFQGTLGLTNRTAARKRARTHDARALAVQSTDAALSSTGELDVAAFVEAREYEIRALEEGMRNSKGALSTRAFQKVPRALRRRTASHNVKRIPRRLRARAKREMKEDNTPTATARQRKPTKLLRIRLETARRLQALNAKTRAKRAESKAKSVKKQGENLEREDSHTFKIAPRVPKIKNGKLSRPGPPQAKFRKRQRDKTWLPTHMFHAKRAHMTPPKEPLWRFALPLSPTEKSYRPTHRSAEERGAIAWDMSYISTIQLEGTAQSLEAVLRTVGIEGESAWGKKGRQWREGTRSLHAWTFSARHNKEPIAPVSIIWRAKPQRKVVGVGHVAAEHPEEPRHQELRLGSRKGQKERERIFLRVHPSAFLQLWNDILSVAKKQRPQVLLEDLRFDIGSIEITGPCSTEALVATMKPILSDERSHSQESPENVWPLLSGVTNPSSLPANALLGFSISDPRLSYPLQTLKFTPPVNESDNIAKLLSSWPIDQTQSAPSLFDRSARLVASHRLPSQKAINRRRTLAGPGKQLLLQPLDPQIPVIVLASRSRINSQGRWTVLLPWNCVVSLWYTIMHYPTSSGGVPRFGGVNQQQQLDFERGTPWFPGGFPGTKAGWQWGLRERKKNESEWAQKPKGRRIEFTSVDLGNGRVGEVGRGWTCDWERLIEGPKEIEQNRKDDENNIEMEAKDGENEDLLTGQDGVPPLNIRQLSPSAAELLIACGSNPPSEMRKFIDTPYLMTVRITLLNRGSPTPHARIYRLPTDDDTLYKKWLFLASELRHATRAKHSLNRSVQVAPNCSRARSTDEDRSASEQVEVRRQLATSLLSTPPSEDTTSLAAVHLPIPHEQDLIGFVTSGNYNLAEGKGTGIGSIVVAKVVQFKHDPAEDISLPLVKKIKDNIKPKLKPRKSQNDATRLCIIRSAGERVGRLGVWEVA